MKSKLTQQIPAFIILGIAIALIVGFFIVFAYVILWGVLLGSILWVCAFIKERFIKPKTHRKGRIINYDDFKK